MTKHIQNLERELGFPLFHRTAHVVILTDFGEAFLPYAKELGETQMKCESNLLSKMKNDANTLTIGISPQVSLSRLMKKIDLQQVKKDGYSLVIRHHHNEHLRQLLITGRADVIITTDLESEDENRFTVESYYSDKLCFVCSGDVELTRTNAEKYPYIQIGNDSYYGRIFHHFRHPDFQLPNTRLAFETLEHFPGFTICTETQSRYLIPPSLHIQPTFFEVTIPFYLMYKLPGVKLPYTDLLLSFLKQISNGSDE